MRVHGHWPFWLHDRTSAGTEAHQPRRLPITVRLLFLYPRAWRERYGAELDELLTDEPATAMALLHVLLGALDAHLHPSLLPAPLQTASDRLRTTTLTIFCASVGFLVAALALFEGATDLAFAPLMRTDPLLRPSATVFLVGAALALAAVLVGGAPILVVVVREARVARRRDLWLLAVVPLSLVVLGACDGFEELLRHNRIILPSPLGLVLDLVFHAFFVLAALGCTVAIYVAVLHSSARARLFRFALVAAAVATLAMIVVAGASAIWLVRARADAPDRLGQGPLALGFAVLLALMVSSTALATGAVVRGLAARAAARTSLNAVEC